MLRGVVSPASSTGTNLFTLLNGSHAVPPENGDRPASAVGAPRLTFDDFMACVRQAAPVRGELVLQLLRASAESLAKAVDALSEMLLLWNMRDVHRSGHLGPAAVADILSTMGIEFCEADVAAAMLRMHERGTPEIEASELASLFTGGDDGEANVTQARMRDTARAMEARGSGVVHESAEQARRGRQEALAAFVGAAHVALPLFVVIYYTVASALYYAATGGTEEPTLAHTVVDAAIDLVFAGWFILKLLFVPREIRGQVIHAHRAILRSYVPTLEFAVDAIYVLPVSWVWIGMTLGGGAPGLYAYYRLHKVLALYHVDSLFKRALQRFSPTIVRVLATLMVFITVAHVLACVLIYLAIGMGEARFVEMLGTARFLSNRGSMYLTAILYSIRTMQGVFTGPINVADDELVVFALVAVCIGLPLMAVLLSTIAHAVNADTAERRLRDRIDALRDFFDYKNAASTIGFTPEIEADCVRYYRHLHATTGSMDAKADPLRDMPPDLTIQVRVEMGGLLLRTVPIFAEACGNLEFVSELSSHLTPRVFEPEQLVVAKGDLGDEMFFISFAEFHVVADDAARTVVFTLRKGDFFGEIALLHEVKRTATIVCGARYANAMRLGRASFEEVLAAFPTCMASIALAADARLHQIVAREADEERSAGAAKREDRQKKRSKSIAGGAALDAAKSECAKAFVARSQHLAASSYLSQATSRSHTPRDTCLRPAAKPPRGAAATKANSAAAARRLEQDAGPPALLGFDVDDGSGDSHDASIDAGDPNELTTCAK
jgi:CRP-like cAMP-binding protein